ncbi:S-adenosylmethionine decarboxylase [Hyphopichia burtonii NRRL Y-1933]|uniref:adenosylmethionine decarboxylase n=1 Tax=Hyphopichia burtonii NRRL Y-1933 TaxID=984485 RepID=A0A1E4RCD0_9ASCO|nr:S-adenosylmethionine decarboxylase [Hyphopichia burtonii NRRL Y-1933]ODV64785.1 S-adenosylmethionine decarboxylase [Hyphopichia burtonii NRRL Y-1933]
MVAPAYIEDNYIDHELLANLDSTFAFEGPEKLLEIWFWSNETRIPDGITKEGLRSIKLEDWVKILDLVNCKILSMKSSKYMDSYLLSESSLFVFPHKLILKTCGTTTTLACLEDLFKIICNYLGESIDSFKIFKIFYSRRSFMFPDKQKHVHRDWKNEVKLLNEFFINGKSYVVGDFTSDDHWYLYMGGEQVVSDNDCCNDQTFEVLMTELNPNKAINFITDRKPGIDSLGEDDDKGHENGYKTMKFTGLDSIFKSSEVQLPSPSLSDNMEFNDDEDAEVVPLNKFDFIHDAFSFSPCGYSSNSIDLENGGYYYTLHITPESGWSYASFETNYPFSESNQVSISQVLIKILSIFEPGNFSVTLINEMKQTSNNDLNDLINCDEILNKIGYTKQEKILYDLKNEYNLLYLNFKKSTN